MPKTFDIKPFIDKQIELNNVLNPNWITLQANKDSAWDFTACILNELEELRDCSSWKHWKPAKPLNISNAKLELTDILHFVLSEMAVIIAHNPAQLEEVNSLFEDFLNQSKDELYTAYQLDSAAKESPLTLSWFATNMQFQQIQQNRSALIALMNFTCLEFLDCDITEIFKLYAGKVALNKFRWANGYREGTYVKDWNGREDNAYLMEFLDTLDASDDDVEAKVMDYLQACYTNL